MSLYWQASVEEDGSVVVSAPTEGSNSYNDIELTVTGDMLDSEKLAFAGSIADMLNESIE